MDQLRGETFAAFGISPRLVSSQSSSRAALHKPPANPAVLSRIMQSTVETFGCLVNTLTVLEPIRQARNLSAGESNEFSYRARHRYRAPVLRHGPFVNMPRSIDISRTIVARQDLLRSRDISGRETSEEPEVALIARHRVRILFGRDILQIYAFSSRRHEGRGIFKLAKLETTLIPSCQLHDRWRKLAKVYRRR